MLVDIGSESCLYSANTGTGDDLGNEPMPSVFADNLNHHGLEMSVTGRYTVGIAKLTRVSQAIKSSIALFRAIHSDKKGIAN